MPLPSEGTIRNEERMMVVRQELYRKSQDIIRVYNPLEHEFRYKYEGYVHKIGPNETKDIRRFLAAHYLKKISEYILGQEMLVRGNELKEKRERDSGHKFTDKYVENKEVWDQAGKLDDSDRKEEIAKIVVLGLVEEYGMEVPEDMPMDVTPIDYRPLENRIMDSFNTPISKDVPFTTTKVKPLNKVSASEVSSE